MEYLKIVLEVLCVLFDVWLTIMLVYQLYLNFYGYRRKNKDYADHEPEARFLVLVPAHNEEKVIGDIIDNLSRMDYPKELYDFYIIADNCTDNTAQAAMDAGAKVLVTQKETPDAPTGKPIALKKALNMLGDYYDRYDLMMIFDADNLMDTNMFREINSQYQDKGKPDFIQCYLGCKNKGGIIAWFYYTSYVVVNRFTQQAKNRLKLNASIGGTGFAVSTSFLKDRGGWSTMSLTEDFEMQVEATLAGRRILWNHYTRVYDEKPTSIVASFKQKTRWSQGYTYVAVRNTRKFLTSFIKGQLPLREFLSLGTYMYGMFTYIVVLMRAIAALLLGLLTGTAYYVQPVSVWSMLPSVLMFIYSYLFLFYWADWLDNGEKFRWRTVPLLLWSLVVNMGISIASQVVGLIRYRHQDNWVKTEHKLHGDQTTLDA